MEPTSHTPEQVSLDSLRRHRAELRESMSALEEALAAPVAEGREHWTSRVHTTLADLAEDFNAHMEITEGPDGLYQELLAASPRLADAVAQLTKEHGEIKGLIGDVLAVVGAPDCDVDLVRDEGTRLLGRLVRHRQRGSDLVYEAYEFDIGGDT
jgi:hypothetical protein